MLVWQWLPLLLFLSLLKFQQVQNWQKFRNLFAVTVLKLQLSTHTNLKVYQESHVIRDLLEGLVNQDGDSNTIPGVAENWETTDNKTFTFHLRKDAKWSNGDPAQQLKILYTAGNVQLILQQLHTLGMEYTKMANARLTKRNEVRVGRRCQSLVDANTLVVELETAVPYFVMMMGHTTVKLITPGNGWEIRWPVD